MSRQPEFKLVNGPTTPRTANGKFVKGAPKAVTAGRAKGTPNKRTALLRDAILEAAAQLGDNGKGRDGLVGFLRRLAARQPTVYAKLLERVLPLQVAVKEASPAPRYTAAEAVERLRERGLPVPVALLTLSEGVNRVPVNVAEGYEDELAGVGLDSEGEDADDTE